MIKSVCDEKRRKISMRTKIISKTIIFGIILLFIGVGIIPLVHSGGAWWNENWCYRKQITIDHTKVISQLQNFPVLIDSVSSDYITHAQPDGDDFVFTTDAGVMLNHEIESYDSTSGKLVAWVNVTSLSPTEDTIIWLYYGNPTCSNQQNVEGTWNSDYQAVWHLKDETSTTTKDSTANTYQGTKKGINEPTESNGMISKAQVFDGANDYIKHGDILDNIFTGTNAQFTISCWMKMTTYSDNACMVGKNGDSNQGEDNREWVFYCINYTYTNYLPKFAFLAMYDLPQGHNYRLYMSDTQYTINQWYYVTTTYNAALDPAVRGKIFVNGTPETGSVYQTGTGSIQDGSAQLSIGGYIGQSGSNVASPFPGIIDEVRISKGIRSNGWIQTEYNTMYSPATFMSIGQEQTNTPPSNALFPTDDTFINQNVPDGNMGNVAWLRVRGYSGWAIYTLIKFDVSSIPSGSIINSATLNLKYRTEPGEGNPVGHTLETHKILNNWNEETVTWNTQPTHEQTATSSAIVPATSNTWMTWNVINDVQSFVNGTKTNYGWKIIDIVDSQDIPYFYSKEYNSSIPYLEINYTIPKENIPPTADAGGPYYANVNNAITFDGSGSSDTDGTIVGYRWDFTNDGIYDTGWLTSATTTHSYPAVGTYTVNLQVKDNAGAYDTDTTTVTITSESGAIPTANINGPYSGYVNYPVSFSSAGSIGGSEGTITSWYWTFGDGAVSSQQNPTHIYSSSGTFTVTLKVTNNYGQTDTVTTTATITKLSSNQIPPVANAGGPYTGVVGSPITFNGSESRDLDGTIVSNVWNFGDSTTGTGVSPTHTYTIAGNYTVILTVTDNESLTNSNSTTARIKPIGLPTIKIKVDLSNIEPIEEENEKTFSVTVQCENQSVGNIHLEILEFSNLTVISLPSNITLNPGESRELLVTIKAPKLKANVTVGSATIKLKAVGDGNITSNTEQINFKVIPPGTPGFETITTITAVGTAGALVAFFRRRHRNR